MVTLKKGLKIAKAAGLVDSVATMQLCQPPAVNNTTHHYGDKHNSSIHTTHNRRQRPNKVTHNDATNLPSNVNRADLDSFHAAYGFKLSPCLLYTSDAADDLLCVDLGGRRIIKKRP